MSLGKTIQEIEVGNKYESCHTIKDNLLDAYADVVGDKNPIHLDESFAAKTTFRHRIAHGMLIAGYISEAIGMHLPGPGCIYAKQDLKFTAPVYIGDCITVIIEVETKDEKRNRLQLKTTCVNQDGKTVIDGVAIVLPRKE